VRVFGIDPGSVCTGFGCVVSDGIRHRLVTAGAILTPARAGLPQKLLAIHRELIAEIGRARPDCVVVENVFHAANVRSALILGQARGVALLAAVEAGLPVFEYTPAEVKRAIVGYGRADKHQVQRMVMLLLGLAEPPTPYDASDALANALCHLHARELADKVEDTAGIRVPVAAVPRAARSQSWRRLRDADLAALIARPRHASVKG
jgi:crossover junction endodeoxyribonuclease RuvC